MFASRCNYDIAEGHDQPARPIPGCSSNRGASAVRAVPRSRRSRRFRDDPSRTVVRTSTTELHRADVALPGGATLYYSGIDPHLGPIVKYAEVDPDDRA
jgi:hypothetical protein